MNWSVTSETVPLFRNQMCYLFLAHFPHAVLTNENFLSIQAGQTNTPEKQSNRGFINYSYPRPLWLKHRFTINTVKIELKGMWP